MVETLDASNEHLNNNIIVEILKILTNTSLDEVCQTF